MRYQNQESDMQYDQETSTSISKNQQACKKFLEQKQKSGDRRESYLGKSQKDLSRVSVATFQQQNQSYSMKDTSNSSFKINQEQYPGTNEMNTGRTQYAKVDTSNF